MEAIEKMKEGKKVRRKHWDTMSGFALFESKGVGLVFTNNRFSDKITVADAEATDWEVFDEEKDWELRFHQQTYPAATLGIRHPGNEHLYFEKHVKKCRDLLIQDLDEDLEEGSALRHDQRRIWHNWFKKIVKGRFGDL